MQRNEKSEKQLARLLTERGVCNEKLKITWTSLTGSTNADAKLYAKEATGDAVFIADAQSAGRGRLGRSFSSAGGGLYMSLLFGRTMAPDEALKITVYAAVTVANAIKKLCAADVKIKWVNDLFLGEKKLGGILCEGAVDERGRITHAVLGIGINLFKPDDPDLSDIATSLSEHIDSLPSKEELAAAIIGEIYAKGGADFASVIDSYRALSIIVGKRVKVIKPTAEYYASVLGIDECGALIIKTDSGEAEHLATGEVSVRF